MAEVTYTARLKARYLEEVRDRLQEKHGYKSPMEIPRLLGPALPELVPAGKDLL